MKCAIHYDRDAVGACVSCGRLVCLECKTSIDGQIYCNTCLEARLKTGAWPSRTLPDAGLAVPPEAKVWNWGAFLLTWIWGIGNNVWISLLALLGLIPYIGWIANLAVAIILGLRGGEWAWQNKRWDSIEHFQKTQRAWMWWGVGALILQVLLALFLIALVIVGLIAAGYLSLDEGLDLELPQEWW